MMCLAGHTTTPNEMSMCEEGHDGAASESSTDSTDATAELTTTLSVETDAAESTSPVSTTTVSVSVETSAETTVVATTSSPTESPTTTSPSMAPTEPPSTLAPTAPVCSSVPTAWADIDGDTCADYATKKYVIKAFAGRDIGIFMFGVSMIPLGDIRCCFSFCCVLAVKLCNQCSIS